MSEDRKRIKPDFWAGSTPKGILSALNTELRQSIVSIKGYSRLLLDYPDLGQDERQEAAQTINDHIEFVESVLDAVSEYLKTQ